MQLRILFILHKEVHDVIGVRRGGKSSLLGLIINDLQIEDEQVLYVNFEEPAFGTDIGIELLDAIWFVYKTKINPNKKTYIFFDEVQMVPQWERWIRKVYDLGLATVFVTGSSSQLLSREFGTALTGRHITTTLYPLSFKEYINFQDSNNNGKEAYQFQLNKYLLEGGFPEVVLTKNTELVKQYFEDIIYKDIVLRHEIRDANALRKLAQYCITNVASIISYNSLKNTFGISIDAVKSYLSYMEEAFLFFQLSSFEYSLKAQEYGMRKIFCIDNGLRNAVSFSFSKDEGKLAENLVFIELKRRGKDIYFWKQRHEVDFVIKEKDNSLISINVTYSNKVDEREIKGLLEFQANYKKKVKKLIIITKNIEKVEKEIKYVPLWKWLLC